ncbi:MAG: serine/threonine-protein kinase PknK, partial [Spirochaetaceae bacterium]
MAEQRYKIEKELYSGARTVIYRGRDEQSQKAVVIKALAGEYPEAEETRALEAEYAMAKTLEGIEGVTRVLDLVAWGNGKAMVMEDLGGESLDKAVDGKPLGTEEALAIACRIAGTLEAIHGRGVMYKDMKPHNVIVDRKSGKVEIVDFGISSAYSREEQADSAKKGLEGTLAYISPEQTGRMNRSVDWRTDFYSFGVMLFEMLTGKRPFDGADALELVHAHMAKQAPSPSSINPEAGGALDAIVLKLLAKNAEDRYQSATGLLADLLTALEMKRKKGKIEDFAIGTKDVSMKFQIPEKLYGREKETEELLQLFMEVGGGQNRIVFVKGPGGIGKSALINELYKPITARRGYFVSGKFDQMRRNIPYSAIIQAYSLLVKQILSQSEDVIAGWRERILKAVGNNGKIITDVLPLVEQIIGKQAELAELGPQESQNRFNHTFGSFVGMCSSAQSPLVLVIDDLQWSDAASLHLLKLLLTDREVQGLMFIGLYRDNEVDASHQLTSTLKELKEEGVVPWDVTVRPLTAAEINRLVSDTLKRTEESTKKLSGMIEQKTAGNPFFVHELFRQLYHDKLVAHDGKTWVFDEAKISKASITGNVVELLAKKISELPADTLELVKVASCFGTRFYADTLAQIVGKSEDEVAKTLLPAFADGLLIKQETGMGFVHDRVLEAAYSLVEGDAKKQLHYKIGKAMLAGTTDDELDEKLIAILNQLNQALDLLSGDEKQKVLELNLAAGKKAKASAAYEAAVGFLKYGKKLLSQNCWIEYYDQTFEININLGECLFLCGKFEDADSLFSILLENAREKYDRACIIKLKIDMYAGINKFVEGILIGKKLLKEYGIIFPKRTSLLHLIKGIISTGRILKNKKEEQINSLQV